MQQSEKQPAEGVRYARLALAGLDCLLLPLAAASVGIGAWLVEKPNVEFELLHSMSDARFTEEAESALSLQELNSVGRGKGQLEAAGYCLIACGAFAITQILLGWHCAKYRMQGALLVFTLLCMTSSGAHLAAGILGNGYEARVATKVDSGWRQMQNRYFVPLMLATQIDSPTIMSVAVNEMQVKGSCCGFVSPQDIADSKSWQSSIQQNPSTALLKLPITCCPLMPNFTNGVSESSDWVNSWKFLQNPECPVTKVGAYNKACRNFAFEQSQLHQRSLAAQVMGFTGGVVHFVAGISAAALIIMSKKRSTKIEG